MSVTTNGIITGIAPASSLTDADVAALGAFLQGSASLTAPMIIAKDNQTYTRNSTNTAADNTFTTLSSFVIPANSLGPNGTLIVELETQDTGASTGSIQLYVGATTISVELAMTANTYDNRTFYFFNTSTTANKYRNSTVRQGTSAAGFTTTSLDTTVDLTVDVKCRWGGAVLTHTIVQHALRAVVEYGA